MSIQSLSSTFKRDVFLTKILTNAPLIIDLSIDYLLRYSMIMFKKYTFDLIRTCFIDTCMMLKQKDSAQVLKT